MLKAHAYVNYFIIIIINYYYYYQSFKWSEKLLILSIPPFPFPKVLKTNKALDFDKVFLNPNNFHVYNLLQM